MNPDDPTPLDEQCASLLAACHEALLASETAAPLTGPEIPRDLRPRLERDLACVRMLDQAGSARRAFAKVADARSSPPVNSEGNGNELPAAIGRFQIRRELGRGGYGIVFQAYDPQLGREIALKVPRAEAVLSPELRQRFLREARAAAVLDHPNVVPVYDAGEVGPVCYIVSAYCPGSTLDAWLRARAEPVPWQEAADLLATLAEAAHHAHAHGVIHRDLKPSNVLLQIEDCRSQNGEDQSSPPGPSGQSAILNLQSAIPKIADFGLAKLQVAEPGTSDLDCRTASGALLGTPRYMAPEQTFGRSNAIGPAVDIHALGTILYEVLTGRPPFLAETILDTLEQVRLHEPVSPSRLRPRLPRDLETICLKCLQKEPRKRYGSALELAQDLRRLLHGEPVQARAVGAWERAARWAKRRPAVAALLALVVAVTTLGLVLVTWQWQAAITARRITDQNLYFHSIALAERELFLQNWGPAEDLLEQCEEARRGWEWYYLKRLRQAPPIVLPLDERPGMNEGFDLAFHPGSRLLAIPRGDGTIRIWDVTTGREVLTLGGHTDRVLGVAFSPDGRRLASTSEDRTVRVWDAETGQELLHLKGHTDRVIGVAFSPDQGRLLASASNDRTVKLWDAITGELLFDRPGQSIPNPHVHLAFSPDGRRLASGSVDNSVKIWDVMTGREMYTLSGHEQPILNVTFSSDGRRLVSAGRDRLVNVWDLPSGDPGASVPGGRVLAPRFTLPNRTRAVWGMALSPEGQRLAVGGPFSDGNVRVYDVTTRQLLLTLMGDARIVSVAFSPDGRRLASAGADKNVRLWDARTGHEILTLRGHADVIGRLLFSPDGQRLVSASADGTVRVWDASPFDEDADPRIVTLRRHGGDVFSVAFSPDSRRLASASADKLVKVWDAATGREIFVLPDHGDAVMSVAFSPDGRRLLSGSNNGTAILWDAITGEKLLSRDDLDGMVQSVAFSPDSQSFATGSVQMMQLWDVRTGRQLVLRQLAQAEHIHCVVFTPNGKLVAMASGRGSVRFWNVTTGEEVLPLQDHSTRVPSPSFSPDGRLLASGDGDCQVKIWDFMTGLEQRTLSGHTDNVDGTAFSRDGRYLATWSWREVIVWDADSFEQIQTLGRLAGRIWSVAFSPDGGRLAAAGGYKGKGEIKIWDASIWEKQSRKLAKGSTRRGAPEGEHPKGQFTQAFMP